ncbi:5'-methylthioadenosine phosphorylase [Desulfurococcaceae archaeon AG1]|nr:MAG: 5'-methylthioadenosine phosphorylase [Desulfurococcaceae archaeon]GAY26427.1 5'-methylthioadenosine phosphorylase [Desulfurococcaceae archaeon AG1]
MGERKPAHIIAHKGEIAPRVIAVGDPGRAKALASNLLENPRLVNEYRGYLVFTGLYKGFPMTIATHGIGGPSAAIVFEELNMMGARYIVRLGSTGAMIDSIDIGDVIVADSAAYPLGGGIGMYIGNDTAYPASPDIELTYMIYKNLSNKMERIWIGTVYSSDAFYAESEGFVSRWSSKRIISVEMECATLFVISKLRGIRSACVLVASDNLVKGVSVLSSLEVLRERFVEVARIIADTLIEIKNES